MQGESDHWEKASLKSIAVVGDVMLDRYWIGDVQRISPEAPVPVVRMESERATLGGAGNVAANIVGLGCQARLFSLIGQDESGQQLRQQLSDLGITDHLQELSGLLTTQKLRVLGTSQQLIRLDFEQPIADIPASSIHQSVISALQDCDLLILSDYSKGVLQNPEQLITAANAVNIPVFVDTKVHDLEPYRGATLFKPNRREFESLVGACDSLEEIEEKAHALIMQYDFQVILVTLGKEGMLLVRRDHPVQHLNSKAQDVFDVTGAGDTVIATLAVAIASGMDWSVAANFANEAAGVVVGRVGTSIIAKEDLVPAHTPDAGHSLTTLLQRVAFSRQHGKKIVMTNGCFDVLHAGHVQCLEQARALGDCLIVAVNSDDSIRRLKGESRPINTLADRVTVLSGLRAVAWVISFSDDTPQKLIEAIGPDVLVKAADYEVSEIAGAESVLARGGEVKTLPLRAGCSSTKIIAAMDDVSATAETV